jgi:hypothetical protein
MHPLVNEAMKKAAIAWLGVGAGSPYPVWCLWVDDALYVISGPGEQPAPGLAGASTAAVTARGEHGGRIVTWTAQVETVAPHSELWPAVAPQLAGKRLNSTGTDELVARWAQECVLNRLTPTAAPPLSGAALPAEDLAEPPLPSPAVRTTRKPFRLHRVRRRP